MDGIGACCGAVAIGLYAVRAQYGRIYVGGTILYLLMMMAFALSPHPVAAGAALPFPARLRQRKPDRQLLRLRPSRP